VVRSGPELGQNGTTGYQNDITAGVCAGRRMHASAATTASPGAWLVAWTAWTSARRWRSTWALTCRWWWVRAAGWVKADGARTPASSRARRRGSAGQLRPGRSVIRRPGRRGPLGDLGRGLE